MPDGPGRRDCIMTMNTQEEKEMSMTIACKCSRCCFLFDFPRNEKTFECPSCGLNNPTPVEHVDPTFQRARDLWLNKDYYEAERCYELVLASHPQDHEAIWEKLLCHYGVEYVREEGHEGYNLVIHIKHRKLMSEQANFALACRYASENGEDDRRRQYEADAKYVDDALRLIWKYKESGKVYDVFLCHKTSRTDGDKQGYTEDFRRAYHMYHVLRMAGYEVFFAPEDMEGIAGGSSYEAAIFHALESARTMIVICSDKEQLTSVWVYSEWIRYMEMHENEPKRYVLPLVYGGMKMNDLPEKFRNKNLQAFRMGEEGVMERIKERIADATGKIARGSRSDVISPEGDFETRDEGDGCAVVRYKGTGGPVSIPAKIRGRKVVRIDKEAFFRCNTIKRLCLPEGVKAIGDRAFAECAAMQSVTLPQSLEELGASVFYSCPGLEEIELPSRLAKIGDFAFERCVSLESIIIPESVSSIGCNPLMTCTNLRKIFVERSNPDFFVHENLLIHKETGMLISYAAGATGYELRLPDEIRSIGFAALADCGKLRTVHFTDNVREIGKYAFADCLGLSTVIFFPGLEYIDDYAFAGCKELVSVNLPSTLRGIGKKVFHECRYKPRAGELPKGKMKR